MCLAKKIGPSSSLCALCGKECLYLHGLSFSVAGEPEWKTSSGSPFFSQPSLWSPSCQTNPSPERNSTLLHPASMYVNKHSFTVIFDTLDLHQTTKESWDGTLKFIRRVHKNTFFKATECKYLYVVYTTDSVVCVCIYIYICVCGDSLCMETHLAVYWSDFSSL